MIGAMPRSSPRPSSKLISPEVQRRMTALLTRGNSSAQVASVRPPSAQPRVSVISVMSYVADSKGGGGSKRPSLAESLVDINAATSPTKSLEAVAADLINQCDKVGGDRVAPGLRHRLEQVPAILQELRGALSEHRDDWRVQRALASLRQALAQTRSTLQRAQAAWFRRRSRFRDPLRSHIDDLNDAFARLRVAAVQVRARPIAPMPTTPLDEKSDPAVACDAIGSAESTCLLADKHLFGGSPRTIYGRALMSPPQGTASRIAWRPRSGCTRRRL